MNVKSAVKSNSSNPAQWPSRLTGSRLLLKISERSLRIQMDRSMVLLIS